MKSAPSRLLSAGLSRWAQVDLEGSGGLLTAEVSIQDLGTAQHPVKGGVVVVVVVDNDVQIMEC